MLLGNFAVVVVVVVAVGLLPRSAPLAFDVGSSIPFIIGPETLICASGIEDMSAEPARTITGKKSF